MRSIRNSKFFTIDSGESTDMSCAADKLYVKANNITKSLQNHMPCQLIKVEIISFDEKLNCNETIPLPDGIKVVPRRKWLATGLMLKL